MAKIKFYTPNKSFKFKTKEATILGKEDSCEERNERLALARKFSIERHETEKRAKNIFLGSIKK